MKTTFFRRNLKLPAVVISVVMVAVVIVSGIATSVFASGVGTGGTPGSGGSGGHSTDIAFGWHLFDATPGQPGLVDSMTSGSWGDVYSACKDVGQVWMFLIFNSAGTGKEYSLSYAGGHPEFFERNPATGRTYYNNVSTNGVYYAAHYNGDASENTVHNDFNTAVSGGLINPAGYTYGVNVGWFCWNNNPPWNISVTTTTPSTTVEVGDTVTWTHSVVNNGPHATNHQVDYSAPNGGDLPAGSGGTWHMDPTQWSSSNISTYTVQSSDFGKNLCRETDANPSSNTGGTIKSSQSCVRVAKKPKVQVLGGDLRVGAALLGQPPVVGNISTSVSQQATGAYGSWDEYGVLATGTIKGFGSGSAYNFPHGLATYSQCTTSQLTFTNAGTGTCGSSTVIGNYASSQSIPDVASAFAVSGTTPTFHNFGDTALRRIETATGTVNISGGTVNAGNWLVLNAPTATVNITGDINYTSATLNSVDDIPQVIIIANCINIAGNVHNVDAWLIATGTPGTTTNCSGIADGGVLNTCSDVAAGGSLSGTICNTPSGSNRLTINGPVMARHLYMQRTGGANSGTGAGDPAEVFNLRPDAYIWLAARSAQAGYAQAVYTTELPPRF